MITMVGPRCRVTVTLPGLVLPFFAELTLQAFHRVLRVLKSFSQISGSGSYAVIIKHELDLLSIPTTTCRKRPSTKPSNRKLGNGSSSRSSAEALYAAFFHDGHECSVAGFNIPQSLPISYLGKGPSVILVEKVSSR